MRTSSALVAAVAVLAGGCHSAAPGRFSSGDLERIVLVSQDAPSGTQLQLDYSGRRDLGQFAHDDTELKHLRDDGFVLGDVVLFATPGPVQGKQFDPGKTIVVQGITSLYEHADGARTAFERYVGDLETRQLPGVPTIEAPGLGEESIALAGDAADGSPVTVYAWRIDNLVVVVTGSGAIDPGDVRFLADEISRRVDAV